MKGIIPIIFAGTIGSGELALNDPSGTGLGFAAEIAGFGGTDKLDLATFAFSGTPTLSWTQSGSTGTLTITDGTQIAKLTLFGQYAAAGFHTSADSGTGTVITYTPAAPQVALTHR